MRYNSSQKSGLLNKINRHQDYMELASNSNSKVASYFINNTICCFNCREFCRAEYIIRGWLTRQDNQPDQHQQQLVKESFSETSHKSPRLPLKHKKNHSQPIETTHYSFYHRQRRRHIDCTTCKTTNTRRKKSQYQFCTNFLACSLSPAETVTHNSILTSYSTRQNCRPYNKFYYIKSKRAKFKKAFCKLDTTIYT